MLLATQNITYLHCSLDVMVPAAKKAQPTRYKLVGGKCFPFPLL